MLVVLRVGYAWVQWMERFDEVRKGKDKMGPYLWKRSRLWDAVGNWIRLVSDSLLNY